MKAKRLIEEFERSKNLAYESMSQEEVIALIDRLEALTLAHMKQNFRHDRWIERVPPVRLVVDSETRWG